MPVPLRQGQCRRKARLPFCVPNGSHATPVRSSKNPDQPEGKLPLGLAAVGIADGVDAKVVQAHHRRIGRNRRLRKGGGDEGEGTPGGQHQVDRLHVIPAQPRPTRKYWQGRRSTPRPLRRISALPPNSGVSLRLALSRQASGLSSPVTARRANPEGWRTWQAGGLPHYSVVAVWRCA